MFCQLIFNQIPGLIMHLILKVIVCVKLPNVSANHRKRSRNDDVYAVTELEFQVIINNDIKNRKL